MIPDIGDWLRDLAEPAVIEPIPPMAPDRRRRPLPRRPGHVAPRRVRG